MQSSNINYIHICCTEQLPPPIFRTFQHCKYKLITLNDKSACLFTSVPSNFFVLTKYLFCLHLVFKKKILNYIYWSSRSITPFLRLHSSPPNELNRSQPVPSWGNFEFPVWLLRTALWWTALFNVPITRGALGFNVLEAWARSSTKWRLGGFY